MIPVVNNPAILALYENREQASSDPSAVEGVPAEAASDVSGEVPSYPSKKLVFKDGSYRAEDLKE